MAGPPPPVEPNVGPTGGGMPGTSATVQDQDPMEGASMENPEELMVVNRDEAPLKLRVLKTLGTGAFAKVYKAEYQGKVSGLPTTYMKR